MMDSAMAGTDDGLAIISARFGIGAGAGLGPGASSVDDDVAAAAGMGRMRPQRRPIFSFNLPPGMITATAVGSYADLPMQWGPRPGWYWDLTSLSVYGFTAGAVAVSKNAPMVTAAGNQWAIEPEASFSQAGIVPFPQHGIPLLDPTERLVFCVTAALTGYAQVSGQVVCVPAERLDEYLS
jgi:hypothetical protein